MAQFSPVIKAQLQLIQILYKPYIQSPCTGKSYIDTKASYICVKARYIRVCNNCIRLSHIRNYTPTLLNISAYKIISLVYIP